MGALRLLICSLGVVAFTLLGCPAADDDDSGAATDDDDTTGQPPGGDDDDSNIVTVEGVGFDITESDDFTLYTVPTPTDEDWTYTGYGFLEGRAYFVDFGKETIEDVPCVHMTMALVIDPGEEPIVETISWAALSTDGAIYLLRSIDFGVVTEDLIVLVPAEVSLDTPPWTDPAGGTMRFCGVGVDTPTSGHSDAVCIASEEQGVDFYFVAGVGNVEVDFSAMFGQAAGLLLD